ncbi:cyclic diguanylate phosphodiesterase [Buttiauxella sp. A111]|uniref:EAL domain-containing protein n=1 Tax=Buttiauxella sp. A111 TaxID=2563088 RepID=UPI0010D6117F|nr:cyclic diguanylate phosphodiesterase [Buttiauxella sp. A111]GDX06417.1 cyclic diguanylate phosphodiesterase [Buttiauxella sp. A111]
MQKSVIPLITAVLFFLTGTFILNLQLWFSAGFANTAGAVRAAKSIDGILEEARVATGEGMAIAEAECTSEAQYRLGTEAALEPHLRTILIIKHDKIWCSSLPGNRLLLANIAELPDTMLALVQARYSLNGLPVLLYQTSIQEGKIIVTISDSHIRDALNTSLKNTHFMLVVHGRAIGLTGAVKDHSSSDEKYGFVQSNNYPFRVVYNHPAFFSLQRLFDQGAGMLLFILLISCAVAYSLHKYFNKYTTPEDTLRSAIDNGEIVPFYQPIVNGRTGTLRGVEVLARWKHPTAGFISPASFIPIAEKSGLIVQLTQSLMAQVIANMNAITSKLPEGFHLGINFSATHINSPAFLDDCMQYRDSFQCKDLTHVIEVTEREPLNVDEQLITKLNILHDSGFAIALDDFGTGYSGLSYLNDLQIDYIKIDQSFVGRVNENAESTILLDCVIDLASRLSLSIVAEGVETLAQVEYLNRHNITFLQGYYFYKPVSFTELVKILLSRPREKVVIE